MTKVKILESRIEELESRVGEIEKQLALSRDPLYEDAKRLVIKHNKATILFLQKKLFIDFERAARILEYLKTDGVIKTG